MQHADNNDQRWFHASQCPESIDYLKNQTIVPSVAQLEERETVIGYTCISRSPDRRWFGGFFCIHNLIFHWTSSYNILRTPRNVNLTRQRCALVHRPLSTGCNPDLKEEEQRDASDPPKARRWPVLFKHVDITTLKYTSISHSCFT